MLEKENSTRKPTQERAKIRVEAILNATKELIVEQGIPNIKIQEIAKRAKVTPGSIYQYFPSKKAIIYDLLDEYIDIIQKMFIGAIRPLKTISDLGEMMEDILDKYYQLYCKEKVLRDIVAWGDMDKEIQGMDIADSLKTANQVLQLSQHLIPDQSQEDFQRYLFLLSHLATSLVKLASSLEGEEAEKMINMGKRMLTSEMFKSFL